jgi:GT2 family glycosyltransferase
MLENIEADYIVTLDNDMEVPKYWLEDMILRINEDKLIVGVCSKCVLPNKLVQFTGGSVNTDPKGYSLFNAVDYGKVSNDLSTMYEYDCDWLPGGATLWRGDISKIAKHSPEYINAFEDFDYSLQISKGGYRMVNCPNVTFIHYHSSSLSNSQKEKEKKYIKDRNNTDNLILSLSAFYKRTDLVMKHEQIFKFLNISDEDAPSEAIKVITKRATKILNSR